MGIMTSASWSRSTSNARQARLGHFFEGRFARAQAMLNQWATQLPASDWRIRLLHKALYSAWADLRQLQRPEVATAGSGN